MANVIGDMRVLIGEDGIFKYVTKDVFERYAVPLETRPAKPALGKAELDLKPHVQVLADAGYVVIKREILKELYNDHRLLQAIKSMKANAQAQADKSE
jgi:hypothetical protein